MEQTYSQKTDKVVQPKGNEYGSVIDLSGQSEDLQNKNKLTSTTAQCKNHFTRDCSGQTVSLQSKSNMMNDIIQQKPVTSPRLNNTGLPDDLKNGVESLSGYSLDDVRVHYNSSKPATVQALAYTQGTEIHVAPGQEHTLPHEAWHVTQQMAGRVSPTTTVSDMPINDNDSLEHEADIMGEKATQRKEIRSEAVTQQKTSESINQNVAQRYISAVTYPYPNKNTKRLQRINFFKTILDNEDYTYFESSNPNVDNEQLSGYIQDKKHNCLKEIENIKKNTSLEEEPRTKQVNAIRDTSILNCSSSEEIDEELTKIMKAMKTESHTPAFKGADYFCRGNDGDHLYNDLGNDVLSKLGINQYDFTEKRNLYKAHNVQHNLNESDENRLDYSLARNAFEQTYQYFRSEGFDQGEEKLVLGKLRELLHKLFEKAIDPAVKGYYADHSTLPTYKSGPNALLENGHVKINEITSTFNEIEENVWKDVVAKIKNTPEPPPQQ